MTKINYLIKRMAAATIDLLLFGLVFKAVESFVSYKNIDGKNYTHTGIFFLLYYLVFILQDIFINKTIGKHLLKFEMKFNENHEIKGLKKYFKLVIRRTFDLLELVCPLIYIIFILSTKKNQKLGDLISKIIISQKDE